MLPLFSRFLTDCVNRQKEKEAGVGRMWVIGLIASSRSSASNSASSSRVLTGMSRGSSSRQSAVGHQMP